MITRRHAIKTTLTALAAGLASDQLTPTVAQAQAPANPTGPHTLAPLPYPADALEPHIDARTMEIHHGRHHAAYVNNLNRALADQTALAAKPLEALLRDLSAVPESIRTTVRNNGGGHYNHALFWQIMSPKGGGEPKGELAQAINQAFGGFAAFKEEFSKAAVGQFGSGWAWLCWRGGAKKLTVEASPNQDSPTMQQAMPEVMRQRYGLTAPVPILGVDVWEHAYYLKYQNRRADYVAAFFNVIDWDQVADRFQKAQRNS
jgi:superoxide dismutase, Fe-Mn family